MPKKFRKVYHFAKSAGNRCGTILFRLVFLKNAFRKCHIDKSKKLGYTVLWSFLEYFRKVIYFAKSPDDQKMENFMREKLDEAVWLRT